MSSSPLLLRGMTWNHTRGYLPMVATAEVKTVLPQANPHGGEPAVVLEGAPAPPHGALAT